MTPMTNSSIMEEFKPDCDHYDALNRHKTAKAMVFFNPKTETISIKTDGKGKKILYTMSKLKAFFIDIAQSLFGCCKNISFTCTDIKEMSDEFRGLNPLVAEKNDVIQKVMNEKIEAGKRIARALGEN